MDVCKLERESVCVVCVCFVCLWLMLAICQPVSCKMCKRQGKGRCERGWKGRCECGWKGRCIISSVCCQLYAWLLYVLLAGRRVVFCYQVWHSFLLWQVGLTIVALCFGCRQESCILPSSLAFLSSMTSWFDHCCFMSLLIPIVHFFLFVSLRRPSTMDGMLNLKSKTNLFLLCDFPSFFFFFFLVIPITISRFPTLSLSLSHCKVLDSNSFFALFLRCILVCPNLYSCLMYWMLLCLSSGTDL